MGIRQLPSGAFQVRFQHRNVAYAATFLTRELAEEAEPELRAAALSGRPQPNPGAGHDLPTSSSPTTRQPSAPPPEQVRSSSAAAAAAMDTLLADLPLPATPDATPEPDQLLTTAQAAGLLGVTRPTLVAWLEAGRIPHQRAGTHCRVRSTDVLEYRDQHR